MVRCHRSSGTPRQNAKHQKSHGEPDTSARCGTCMHIGHAGGPKALLFRWTCFNRQSKQYMRNVYRTSLPCPCYVRNMSVT